MDILFAVLGAGSAGSFLAIGAAANAHLKHTLKSPIAAATVNFFVGFISLALLIALGVFASPDWGKFGQVPGWAFAGGVLGALFVSLNTVTVSHLGLTTSTLAVVCSQMFMSLLIDQFGWFGVPGQMLNGSRVFAIALLMAAIALMQLDRRNLKKR